MSDLTYQDVLNILRLIDAGPFAQMELEFEGTRLKVTRRSEGSAAATALPTMVRADTRRAGKVAEAHQGHAPDPHALNGQGALPGTAASQPRPVAVPADAAASGVTVKPPMAGTFYAAPSPNAEPFVKVDQAVRKGDQLGIVEVMKLFTPVIAPCDGTVSAILVENEAFVQAEQTLMVIRAAL